MEGNSRRGGGGYHTIAAQGDISCRSIIIILHSSTIPIAAGRWPSSCGKNALFSKVGFGGPGNEATRRARRPRGQPQPRKTNRARHGTGSRYYAV
jgi:hypothetical protein